MRLEDRVLEMRLIPSPPEDASPRDEAHLRRLAMQLVLQLPPDQAEALAVLGYAQELVTGYLGAAATALKVVS